MKRLRVRLGSAGTQLVTCRPGYRLEVAEDEPDLRVFTRLCLDGGVAVRAGGHRGRATIPMGPAGLYVWAACIRPQTRQNQEQPT